LEQTPSVGRIVHYVAYGTPGGEYPVGEHRAAVITEVGFDGSSETGSVARVGLCILNPTGMFFTRGLREDPTGQTPGSWHWPERV
jgi:hypothetical protein